jgi:hypothetical protein
MANLACSGAHHSSLKITQTRTRKRVHGICSVTTDCKTPQSTHTPWPLHGLHNTAHTPFSSPLPCTSLQPNNHRMISDAELKLFRTQRLSVSFMQCAYREGATPLSMHLVILGHRDELRPIPTPRPSATPQNAVKHMHSTTEQHTTHALDPAGRSDNAYTLTLVRVPSALQLAHRKRLPLDVSCAAALTPHLHQAVAAFARAPAPARFRAHICVFVGICCI